MLTGSACNDDDSPTGTGGGGSEECWVRLDSTVSTTYAKVYTNVPINEFTEVLNSVGRQIAPAFKDTIYNVAIGFSEHNPGMTAFADVYANATHQAMTPQFHQDPDSGFFYAGEIYSDAGATLTGETAGYIASCSTTTTVDFYFAKEGTFYTHVGGTIHFRFMNGWAKVELYAWDILGWRLIKDAQYVQSVPGPETRTATFIKNLTGYRTWKLRLITGGSERRDETNSGTAARSHVEFQPAIYVTTSNMPTLQ
jgi:hypothetical protein